MREAGGYAKIAWAKMATETLIIDHVIIYDPRGGTINKNNVCYFLSLSLPQDNVRGEKRQRTSKMWIPKRQDPPSTEPTRRGSDLLQRRAKRGGKAPRARPPPRPWVGRPGRSRENRATNYTIPERAQLGAKLFLHAF